MKSLQEELLKKNIVMITPDNEDLLQDGVFENVLELLKSIWVKYPNEEYYMCPKLTDVTLVSGEAFEAVAPTNFTKNGMEVFGIFIYDKKKQDYNSVKKIVNEALQFTE